MGIWSIMKPDYDYTHVQCTLYSVHIIHCIRVQSLEFHENFTVSFINHNFARYSWDILFNIIITK